MQRVKYPISYQVNTELELSVVCLDINTLKQKSFSSPDLQFIFAMKPERSVG